METTERKCGPRCGSPSTTVGTRERGEWRWRRWWWAEKRRTHDEGRRWQGWWWRTFSSVFLFSSSSPFYCVSYGQEDYHSYSYFYYYWRSSWGQDDFSLRHHYPHHPDQDDYHYHQEDYDHDDYHDKDPLHPHLARSSEDEDDGTAPPPPALVEARVVVMEEATTLPVATRARRGLPIDKMDRQSARAKGEEVLLPVALVFSARDARQGQFSFFVAPAVWLPSPSTY